MSPHAYGVMAEFASAEKLLEGARAVRDAGHRHLEAYAPFSVEGLSEALGLPRSRVPLITLIGGLVGGIGAFFMQWYLAVIDYPINSGGRPLNSWPAFIPAVFELTVLGAALAAFFGMVIASGLPRLNHPVFDMPDFDLASRNRFFLCIRSDDPLFDPQASRALLEGFAPVRILEVP